MKNQLVIATPTYNEAGSIETLLRRIHALGLPADVWVIDDGSSDGTGEIVAELREQMPELQLVQRGAKLGIGSAHIDALRRAKAEGYAQLVTLDADFSHQPEDIPRLLAAASEFDVVLGTRFVDRESLVEWSMARKLITHVGHLLTRVLLGVPYDASGALRVYNLDAIPTELIEGIKAANYEFFFESISLLHDGGFRIGEVPVKLPARAYGHSKMQLSHAISAVLRLLQLAYKIRVSRGTVRYAPLRGVAIQHD